MVPPSIERKATHSLPTLNLARGTSSPVASLVVCSISSSDFRTFTVTLMAVCWPSAGALAYWSGRTLATALSIAM